jgi:hypothetical protein
MPAGIGAGNRLAQRREIDHLRGDVGAGWGRPGSGHSERSSDRAKKERHPSRECRSW